jgi:hypothetical protein
MSATTEKRARELGPPMGQWALPAKALATMIVLMLAVGMAGALGQIVVHDIIPTFWGAEKDAVPEMAPKPEASSGRGDLFAEALPTAEKIRPAFHQTDEFVFALKFTHIHIFGMSGIFIAMGALVLFLDVGIGARTVLITLPFVGILIDLASVWLKIFVDPAFFWMHVPGGFLFGLVFALDSVLILKQLWGRKPRAAAVTSEQIERQ